MNQIRYVEGDLFAEIAKAPPGQKILIPHVVNNLGKWGAGFSGPLGEHFPWARDSYLAWHGEDDSPLDMGFIQLVTQEETDRFAIVAIAHMVAQDGIGTKERRIRYNALSRCMDSVARQALECGASIHCPKFGAGLAGGNWDFIEELIRDCWIRRGIHVTVYWLPGKGKVKR